MKKNLTLIQINDTHAYMAPHPEIFYTDEGVEIQEAGGYARIQTVLEEARQNGPVLVLDNGDTFHGTYEAVDSKGWNMIPSVNALGIEAMTFHWDIAYGPDHLKALGEELNHPILAINVYYEDTDELYVDPYTIIEKEGLRIGVIGIAATIIDKTMPPSFSEGLYFTLGNKELPRYVQLLKEKKVDLIVVLSHLGFPQDVKMMTEIKGVDICLSGHTHNRLSEPVQVGETLIMQSGSQSSFIGKLEVELDEDKIVQTTHSLIPVTKEIPENKEMKDLVNKALAPYKEKLDKTVGKTDGILHRGWGTETSMDNLLLEAIQYHTQSDLAFSNGWRYGAPIDKGAITLRQLYQMIPMDPPLSRVEMTGAEIREMLEENLENTYSKNPYLQMGGYVKRSLGLKAFFKIENPTGQRIQKLLIGGEPMKPEHVYSVTYVTNQGVPATFGTNHRELEMHAIEALREYLSDHDSYHAKLHGTFEVI